MFTGQLKPYQVEGVDAMVDRKKMLVAYEMGLGKTCMTIAALEKLKEDKDKPMLIICLSSLKYQWKKEIHKFSDSSATVVDGSAKARQVQWSQPSDYIIVNYEAVVNDWDLIKDRVWGAVVCDEATAIKGFKSKRTRKVKDLSKNVSIRFALTGTPIENGKPEELYSIMQFVDSTVLGRFDLFDQTFIVRNHFGGVQRYRNLDLFHSKMKPVSVRKTQKDEDVAPHLPAEIYLDPVVIPFDSKSQHLYKFISEELENELYEAQQLLGSNFSLLAHYGHESQPGSAVDQMRGSIMSKITALRMLCDHPNLLVESSTKFEKQEGEGSAYIFGLKDRGLLDGLKNSNKFKAVEQYVNDHLSTDDLHKVVIFTSYVGMVDLLSRSFPGSVEYTGRLNAKEKESKKEAFLNDPKTRVLVSSDAGGYGVDLPVANLLINYDLPWSSGLAVQRNSRIKRTSSIWGSVIIQDFIMEGSIEERQHQMLQQKNAISDAIIDGQGINSKGGIDLTVGSLIKFLQNAKK
mgnify:FL=1